MILEYDWLMNSAAECHTLAERYRKSGLRILEAKAREREAVYMKAARRLDPCNGSFAHGTR